jgi:hypothetical protein
MQRVPADPNLDAGQADDGDARSGRQPQRGRRKAVPLEAVMSDDTRDRLIRLEAEVEHLTKGVSAMSAQVKDMHELLMQAKGARWAILGMASVGGFISAKLTALIPWISNTPMPK